MAPYINGKNIYNDIFKNPIVKKWMPKNPTPKQLANLALISTLAKDGINCYYYTTQSLHNEKIPEEKRKFVAALDLSNGIMNIAVPLAAKPLVDKYTEPLFNKWFGKFFNEEAGKKMVKVLQDAKIPKAERAQSYITGNARKFGLGGFSIIIMLVFSQILCKRIITPTISTPMADIFKKKLEQMEEKNKKCEEAKKTENTDSDDSETEPVKQTEEKNGSKESSDNQQPALPDKVNVFSNPDFNQLVVKLPKYTK